MKQIKQKELALYLMEQVLCISYISRPFLNSHAVSFLSNFPSSWRFHGNNRKQHRYLAILSCDFERSVLFSNHIPEKVERRVIVFSERLYLQTITEQAIQHYSQPVVPCNGLLPIVIFRICVGGFFNNVRFLARISISDLRKIFIEHPQYRVKFHNNELSTVFQHL